MKSRLKYQIIKLKKNLFQPRDDDQSKSENARIGVPQRLAIRTKRPNIDNNRNDGSNVKPRHEIRLKQSTLLHKQQLHVRERNAARTRCPIVTIIVKRRQSNTGDNKAATSSE